MWTEREYHVQEDADIARKKLRCFLIQISFRHCYFFSHTQNHMVSEGWVRIII